MLVAEFNEINYCTAAIISWLLTFKHCRIAIVAEQFTTAAIIVNEVVKYFHSQRKIQHDVNFAACYLDDARSVEAIISRPAYSIQEMKLDILVVYGGQWKEQLMKELGYG